MTTSNAPLYRLAWRRLRRRPLQYILFILGVAIGVALMVSIDLANGSARRAFALSTDAVTGKTTHRIIGGPTGLDEALYRRIRAEAGFSPAAPVVEGYVAVPALSDQPLRLIGIDPFAEPPFRSYFAPSGEESGLSLDGLTTFLTEPNAVVVAREMADAAGLNLGDTVTIDISGRLYRASVVGLLQADDDVTRRALAGIIFTDIASAQDMLALSGRLSHIDLIADSDAELAPVVALLPPDVTLETAAARQNAVQQMSAAFELNLMALSLLALVIGMFLIYNTVTFSVVQRRPLFGILRCLGVTGGQLFRLIMGEAILLSLVGSVLGIGLGILLGRSVVGLITQTINDFYFTVNVTGVTVPTSTIVRGLATGVGAAILAALVPAIEAARTEPQSTLRRSTLESRVRRLLPWLVVAWMILTTIGIGLLALRSGGLVTAFSGLFAVLIAAALLAPPVTVLLMKLVSPVTGRLLGVLGRLAPRDIIRSLSRTSIAIAALMTAVSVIVGVSIMVGSFRGTVIQWLDQTLQADIYISPPTVTANRVAGSLDPAIVTAVKAWPGVERAVTSHAVQIELPDFGRLVQLVAVDGDVSAGNRPYAWVRDGLADPWSTLETGEGVIISEALVLKESLPIPPPPITLPTAGGPQAFPVLAVFYDYASDQGTVFIDNDLYQDLWDDPAVSAIGLFVAPGQSTEAVIAEIQAAFTGRQDVLIQSNEALRRGSLEIFDRTFAITSALRLLAIIVAFIGVLSALMSLQLERARELGTLRATGMTRPQLWVMTLLQTGLMGLVAGLLALPVGYALAWILVYVINVRSFGWTLQMELQPEYFIQALAVAVIAALLAGIYPSLRVGNMEIAGALREE
ncbi:MAG: FtsX-like permease family protein [Chloroflexota bacterium]|jgi:putative ABC transport system permease protein